MHYYYIMDVISQSSSIKLYFPVVAIAGETIWLAATSSVITADR